LFWSGRLIIAATGFCAALARSAWSCANAADVSDSSAAVNSKSRVVIAQAPKFGRLGTGGRLPRNVLPSVSGSKRWRPRGRGVSAFVPVTDHLEVVERECLVEEGLLRRVEAEVDEPAVIADRLHVALEPRIRPDAGFH
jgi:hypothetical protein